MKIFIPVGLIFLFNMTKAQNLKWGSSHNVMATFSPYQSVNKGIETDNQKNLVTFGKFVDSIDFDPGPGSFMITAAGEDNYLQKLDSNGNFKWAFSLDGLGNSPSISAMTIDQNDNIIITGELSGTADFDPSPGYYYLSATINTATHDLFIAKYDSSGGLIWAKTIGSPNDAEKVVSITTDKSNNILLLACFSSNTDCDPNNGTIFLPSGTNMVKLGSTGNTIWAKHISNENFYMIADQYDNPSQYRVIKTDKNNNIYTAGVLASSNDFDPGPNQFNLTGTASYLQKLDSNGNFKWAKKFGVELLFIPRIDIDTSDNVFFVSYHDSMDNSTYIPVGHYIHKLDGGGNTIWRDEINVNQPWVNMKSIKADVHGNLLAVFSTYDPFQIKTPNGITSYLGGHSVLMNLNPNGGLNKIQLQQHGSIQAITTKSDDLFISGTLDGSLDIDFSSMNYILTGNGPCEYVARYKRCLSLSPIIVFNGSDLLCNNVPPNSNYTWYLNGSPYGSNTSTVTINSNGTYSIEVLSVDGCFGTDTITVSALNFASENDISPVQIYPNPTTNTINFQLPMQDYFTCILYDVVGHKINETNFRNTQQVYQISLEKYSLSDGIYFLQLIGTSSGINNVFRVNYQR